LFQVKVCGVTRIEDIDLLSDAGVDAVGINLVPGSPRCVSLPQAYDLCHHAHILGITTVAVTMDLDTNQLEKITDTVMPDLLQLHGHESPAVLSQRLRLRPIIKALSWSGRAEETELAGSWLADRPNNLAFLVDAYAPGVGGGTGKVARWDLLWPRPELLSEVPLLLAGGLTGDNVAQAIEATRCVGVDTASGVESSPGIKDAHKVKQFATAARQALPPRRTLR
jgi:phosphoribosylanthranilate isomerase